MRRFHKSASNAFIKRYKRRNRRLGFPRIFYRYPLILDGIRGIFVHKNVTLNHIFQIHAIPLKPSKHPMISDIGLSVVEVSVLVVILPAFPKPPVPFGTARHR